MDRRNRRLKEIFHESERKNGRTDYYYNIWRGRCRHDRFQFGRQDAGISVICLIIGTVIMVMSRKRIYGFLIGAFVIVCGNLCMLFKKYIERTEQL